MWTEPLSPAELDAIRLSLRVALVATSLGLPLAAATAWLLARRDFRGKTLLDAAVHLPLVLPPVVTGYLLLATFGRAGPLGGLGLAFSPGGATLAAGVMAFPLMVRALRLAFDAVDPGLEDAARTLGAGPVGVARSVTLPLMVPGLLAATILGFAKALGEFGATITFVAAIPGRTETIPSAIYGLLQIPGAEPAALRLVLLSAALALGALVISEALARRGRQRP